MERFTERDIELWRKWMDIETHYARVIKGYGDDKQRWYFAQGVANPEAFSFKQSIVRYLKEAFDMRDLETDLRELPETGRLKFVRAIGKFAHNQIACLVTAQDMFYGGDVDAIYAQTLDRVGGSLNAVASDGDPLQAFLDMDPQIQVAVDRQFDALWDLQLSEHNDRFMAKLSSTAIASSAAFTACSKELGWCTPGIDSREDRIWVPWEIAS